MIDNLPDFEQTRFYKDIVGIGEKRGVKQGDQFRIKREIKRFENLKKSGDLNDKLFKLLCDPLRSELVKITAEINEMMKESQKKK